MLVSEGLIADQSFPGATVPGPQYRITVAGEDLLDRVRDVVTDDTGSMNPGGELSP